MCEEEITQDDLKKKNSTNFKKEEMYEEIINPNIDKQEDNIHKTL